MQNSQERQVTPNNKRGITPTNFNKSQQEGFQTSPVLATLMVGGGEEEHEGAANYKKAIVELEDTIKDLDVKLNRVLAKQEYEYLKGYNVYVKQKERTYFYLSQYFMHTMVVDSNVCDKGMFVSVNA
jgi:hypothetical protein